MTINNVVQAEDLTENTSVFIRGRLSFSRLTRLIEGDELDKVNQRKVQNGLSPVNMPHTTATITHAEVQFADPNNPTVEERFVDERRFTSRKYPDTGPNYSIDSKGTSLPIIAAPSEKGDGTFDQDHSKRELDRGLDVTLVLRVYKPKNYNKRGLALDQVIVHEKPRYYGAGIVDAGELAARGIVFNAPPVTVLASEASAVGEADQAEAVGTDVEDGLSFPAPQPRPQVTPAQTSVQAATGPVEEIPQQRLARLVAENEALKNAGSAVPEPATASPWDDDVPQQGGITYPS